MECGTGMTLNKEIRRNLGSIVAARFVIAFGSVPNRFDGTKLVVRVVACVSEFCCNVQQGREIFALDNCKVLTAPN